MNGDWCICWRCILFFGCKINHYMLTFVQSIFSKEHSFSIFKHQSNCSANNHSRRCDGVAQCPKGENFDGGEEDEGSFCREGSGEGSGEGSEGEGPEGESEEGSGEGLGVDQVDLRSGF